MSSDDNQEWRPSENVNAHVPYLRRLQCLIYKQGYGSNYHNALRVSFLRFNGKNIIHLSTGYTVSYFSSLFAKFNRLYSPSFLSRNLYEQNQGTMNKNMSFSSTLNKVTKWFRVRQGNRYSIRGGIDGSFLKIINTTLICISCHM